MPDIEPVDDRADGQGTERLQLMEEVESAYAGQWVLLEATELDEARTPLRGTVKAHGTRNRVYKALHRLVVPGERPKALYYLFAAGVLVGPGELRARGSLEQSQ